MSDFSDSLTLTVCTLLILAVIFAIVLAKRNSTANTAKLAAFFTILGDGLALLALSD